MSLFPVIPNLEIDLQIIRDKNGRVKGYKCSTKDPDEAKLFENFPMKLFAGSVNIYLFPPHYLVLEENRSPSRPRKIHIPLNPDIRKEIYGFYGNLGNFTIQPLEDSSLIGFELLG